MKEARERQRPDEHIGDDLTHDDEDHTSTPVIQASVYDRYNQASIHGGATPSGQFSTWENHGAAFTPNPHGQISGA